MIGHSSFCIIRDQITCPCQAVEAGAQPAVWLGIVFGQRQQYDIQVAGRSGVCVCAAGRLHGPVHPEDPGAHSDRYKVHPVALARSLAAMLDGDVVYTASSLIFAKGWLQLGFVVHCRGGACAGPSLGPAGLAITPERQTVVCQHGDRRVALLTDVHSFQTIADRCVAQSLTSCGIVCARSCYWLAVHNGSHRRGRLLLFLCCCNNG